MHQPHHSVSKQGVGDGVSLGLFAGDCAEVLTGGGRLNTGLFSALGGGLVVDAQS